MVRWFSEDFRSPPSATLSMLLVGLGLLFRGGEMAAAASNILSFHTRVKGEKWGRDGDRELTFPGDSQEQKFS